MTDPDIPVLIQEPGERVMIDFLTQKPIRACLFELIHESPAPISTTCFLYISGMKEGKRGLDPGGLISYHVDPYEEQAKRQTDPDRRTAQ